MLHSDGSFNRRYVVLSSVVDWQDTSLLQRPFAGLFRVVLIAESQTHRSLGGKIYFIEKRNSEPTSLKSKISSFFKPRSNTTQETKLLTNLQSICDLKENDNETEKKYATLQKQLDNYNDPPSFAVKFTLDEFGFATLNFENESRTNQSADEHKRSVLVRQAFYYLKYCFHTHTHHHPEAESLSTVHKRLNLARQIKFDTSKNNVAPIGPLVAASLVRDLKRGINDIRVSNVYSGHTTSGIALYGSSLVSSCLSSGKLLKDAANDQQNYFANIRKSIELRSISAANSTASTFLKKLIPSTAVVFSVIGPLLIYLNTRQPKTAAIDLEKNSYCPAIGYGPFESLCTKFYEYLDWYVNGAFLPSAVAIVFILLFILFINLWLVPFSRTTDLSGWIRGIYNRITPVARSYPRANVGFFANLISKFCFCLVLVRLIMRRFYIQLFEGKTIVGVLWMVFIILAVAIACLAAFMQSFKLMLSL